VAPVDNGNALHYFEVALLDGLLDTLNVEDNYPVFLLIRHLLEGYYAEIATAQDLLNFEHVAFTPAARQISALLGNGVKT